MDEIEENEEEEIERKKKEDDTKKKLNQTCDSVALTGTTFTGLVRTQYVLVPSVLLVYLPLTLPGLAVYIVSG